MNLLVSVSATMAVIGAVGTFVNIFFLWRPPRRRISYRVNFDDRVGERPDIKGVAELVVRSRGQDVYRPSFVLIRVKNDGRLDIDEDDYNQPITFSFGGRKVIGVEVKEAAKRLQDMLLGSQQNGDRPSGSGNETLTLDGGQVHLPKMPLNRKDRFQLLVLLSGEGHDVTGDAHLKGGGLVREIGGTGPNRATARTLVWGASVSVSLLVLIGALVFLEPVSPAGESCVPGSIIASGSTAFAPTAIEIAAHYQQSCQPATIAVNPAGSPTGSHAGVRGLATAGHQDSNVRSTQLVMFDGAVKSSEFPDLVGHPVAVIVFSVVVNKTTGIHSLTQEQLRGIYRGEYHNWRQLGGGDQPINIVSRAGDSGTRSTFEENVLEFSEPQESSRDCVHPSKIPDSLVIRCEVSSTDQLLEQVNNIPGAIGYAEMAVVAEKQSSKYKNVNQIQLDGRDASAESVKNNNYPFWTVEHFYTYGSPKEETLLVAFLNYLNTDAARAAMQDKAHIPCVDNQRETIKLCDRTP